MKLLIVILCHLALNSAAGAQTPMPQTMTIKDNATGQIVGTATRWQDRIYLRNAKGELVGFFAIDATGKVTKHDVNGKVLEQPQ